MNVSQSRGFDEKPRLKASDCNASVWLAKLEPVDRLTGHLKLTEREREPAAKHRRDDERTSALAQANLG